MLDQGQSTQHLVGLCLMSCCNKKWIHLIYSSYFSKSRVRESSIRHTVEQILPSIISLQSQLKGVRLFMFFMGVPKSQPRTGPHFDRQLYKHRLLADSLCLEKHRDPFMEISLQDWNSKRASKYWRISLGEKKNVFWNLKLCKNLSSIIWDIGNKGKIKAKYFWTVSGKLILLNSCTITGLWY